MEIPYWIECFRLRRLVLTLESSACVCPSVRSHRFAFTDEHLHLSVQLLVASQSFVPAALSIA